MVYSNDKNLTLYLKFEHYNKSHTNIFHIELAVRTPPALQINVKDAIIFSLVHGRCTTQHNQCWQKIC